MGGRREKPAYGGNPKYYGNNFSIGHSTAFEGDKWLITNGGLNKRKPKIMCKIHKVKDRCFYGQKFGNDGL